MPPAPDGIEFTGEGVGRRARGRRIEPMQAFDGATGRLMLDPDGRVRRGLVWAQFRRGEPVALPDTEPVDQSTPEGSAETEFPAPEVTEEAPWNEGAIELEL